MRHKYYVQCGLIKEVVLATNPIHACIVAFQRLDGPNLVGGIFKVSELGFNFDEHEEGVDTYIGLENILNILVKSADYEPENF